MAARWAGLRSLGVLAFSSPGTRLLASSRVFCRMPLEADPSLSLMLPPSAA